MLPASLLKYIYIQQLFSAFKYFTKYQVKYPYQIAISNAYDKSISIYMVILRYVLPYRRVVCWGRSRSLSTSWSTTSPGLKVTTGRITPIIIACTPQTSPSPLTYSYKYPPYRYLLLPTVLLKLFHKYNFSTHTFLHKYLGLLWILCVKGSLICKSRLRVVCFTWKLVFFVKSMSTFTSTLGIFYV